MLQTCKTILLLKNDTHLAGKDDTHYLPNS